MVRLISGYDYDIEVEQLPRRSNCIGVADGF